MSEKVKKTRIKSISLLFLFLFISNIICNISLFGNYTNSETDLTENIYDHENKPPKSAAFWNNFSFIHITDANWSTAASYDWCSGSGTWSEPYVIENITVDGGGGADCILIQSSTKYFIIRNCTTLNSGSASDDSGIELSDTDNGQIIDCYSHDNNNGIRLSAGSLNNTISNCNVSSNDYGFYVRDSSSNNSIIGNTIKENSLYGVYLFSNANYNNISYNLVRDNENSGIRFVSTCNNNTVSNNTIINNGDSADEHGIYLMTDCDWNNITRNYISQSNDAGIVVSVNCDYNLIEGNSIIDNGVAGSGSHDSGIYLVTSCIFNIIRGNYISGSADHGIEVANGCNNLTITGNIVNYSIYHNFDISNTHSLIISENNISLSTSGTTDGIHLLNSDYNTISKNKIRDNVNFGIYFEDCDVNTVYENILWDHSANFAIEITSTCTNLLFYKNAIYSSFLHVDDDSTSTMWNNTDIGNYWDDYGGSDANRDGIGDTSESINGAGGNTDYLPIYGNPQNTGEKVHIDATGGSGDGNWTWARTRLWCRGSGTWTNPYVISGLEIDVGGIGSGLILGNSSAYAKLEHNGVTGSTDHSGIHLEYTNNTIITNNNCSENDLNGIYILNSKNNTINSNLIRDNIGGSIFFDSCSNSTVSDNELLYNNGVGVQLNTGSLYNTIERNYIINDANYGAIRFSTGCNNNNATENTIINGGSAVYISGASGNLVKNNTMKDSVNTQSAIYITSTSTLNSIVENYINNSLNRGIYLATNCDSNTIYGNYISYNLIGVELNSGSSSNTFYNNSFVGNQKHAQDEDGSNTWSTSIGNYWDNYTGIDADDNNIGDTPHNFDGGGDNLPIWWDGYNTPIHIDESGSSGNGTWAWAISQDWCSGSGTSIDPYIISGLIIDGLGAQITCLKIGNSSDYYKIEDSIFINTGFNGMGIDIVNSTNGVIDNCNASNHWSNGIRIYDDSDNISIINSFFSGTVNDGIRIWNRCNEIIIQNNTFILNSDGIEFYSNDGDIGNYNITISNNEFLNNSNTGIYISGYDNISNYIIESNDFKYNQDGFKIVIYSPHQAQNFTIKNNNITYSDNYALYLNQISNSTISHNNISYNGLSFGDSIYIWNAFFNNFTNNLIKNNSQGSFYAIKITDATSYNNSFVNNIFIGNTLHVIDNGDDNSWDNGSFGNFWDNYTGVDLDDNLIGDAPHIIPGSAGAQDNYPFWDDGLERSFWIFNEIYIGSGGNGTWAWAENQKWCRGSGSSIDPYIIENVTINGQGSDSCFLVDISSVHFIIRNCTIFNSGGGVLDAGIRLVSTNNSEIYNNTIYSNLNYGIYIQTNSYFNNITHNILYLNNDFAIRLSNSNNNTIKDNLITNNLDDGINIYVSSYNDIINNTITNFGDGIHAEWACDYNNISFNKLDNNDGKGIIIETYSDFNLISNNEISFSTDHGIEISRSSGDCTNNQVIGNNISYNDKSGIYIELCKNNTITNNLLYKNTENGIFIVQGNWTTINNNRILLNQIGINITYHSNLTITQNNITYNFIDGVYLFWCNYSLIDNNNISNNGLQGLLLYYSNSNTITNNNACNNADVGIYLDFCIYENISRNFANNNHDGIFLFNSDLCTITNNTANNNNVTTGCGIILSESDNNTITRNTAKNNAYGLSINNSNNNTINDNNETFSYNFLIGVRFLAGQFNNFFNNVVGYNPIGLYLNGVSNGNLVSDNIFLYNNENLKDEGTNIIGANTFYEYPSDTPEDTPPGTPSEPEFPIIIIIIIIIGALLGVSGFVFARKKKTPDEEGVVKPQLKAKPALTLKKKKEKAVDETSKELTEEEKQDLAKTEREVGVEKQKIQCIVHKGPIVGANIYVCPSCKGFYCTKCATALKEKGEKCWSCDNEFEL